MPLPQDINPIRAFADTLVKAGQGEWHETSPGQAWVKVLWTAEESGTWAVIFRWNKGYVAAPHKHLSGAHVYIIKGKLQVRDGLLETGDYVYEPNGVLHGATTALEDTDYLFICNGPLIFHSDDAFTSYLSWEEFERMRVKGGEGAKAVSAGARIIKVPEPAE